MSVVVKYANLRRLPIVNHAVKREPGFYPRIILGTLGGCVISGFLMFLHHINYKHVREEKEWPTEAYMKYHNMNPIHGKKREREREC